MKYLLLFLLLFFCFSCKNKLHDQKYNYNLLQEAKRFDYLWSNVAFDNCIKNGYLDRQDVSMTSDFIDNILVYSQYQVLFYLKNQSNYYLVYSDVYSYETNYFLDHLGYVGEFKVSNYKELEKGWYVIETESTND